MSSCDEKVWGVGVGPGGGVRVPASVLSVLSLAERL